MVLDLDLFRTDKGGDPDKIRAIQKKRYKDVGLVDEVVAKDTLWRQLRHKADNWNKLKNVCSKAIGEKMKNKVAQTEGEESALEEVTAQLDSLTLDTLKPLSVAQIKKV